MQITQSACSRAEVGPRPTSGYLTIRCNVSLDATIRMRELSERSSAHLQLQC